MIKLYWSLAEKSGNVMISLMLMMDHDACRNKVCIVCAKKATRTVSGSEIKAIKNFIDADFNVDSPDYPRGVCTSCSIALNKKNNGKETTLSINQTYKSGQQKRVQIVLTPMSGGIRKKEVIQVMYQEKEVPKIKNYPRQSNGESVEDEWRAPSSEGQNCVCEVCPHPPVTQ